MIDLGCGNGPVGAALVLRFAGRQIIGVDNSPAMLAKAQETGAPIAA
ncbi:MAG: methyltransferase domain-containing protein [Marinosulfonomonas sp.]|nr:methyltransferase domain-containing protein [Marinosulfonomonas sp.]